MSDKSFEGAEDRLRDGAPGGRATGMRRSEARVPAKDRPEAARVDLTPEGQRRMTQAARDSSVPSFGDTPGASDGDADPSDRVPKMSPAFERILSRTFAVDVLALGDELEGQLAIPDADRVDYGTLARRAGEASDNARKAHLLYVNAEAALAEFEARAEATIAALRVRAHESLARLEADGRLSKKKSITNDDVEAEMARIAPDEFERLRVKRRRSQLMVEQLRREAELHRHFPHTIEALLGTSRSPSR